MSVRDTAETVVSRRLPAVVDVVACGLVPPKQGKPGGDGEDAYSDQVVVATAK